MYFIGIVKNLHNFNFVFSKFNVFLPAFKIVFIFNGIGFEASLKT